MVLIYQNSCSIIFRNRSQRGRDHVPVFQLIVQVQAEFCCCFASNPGNLTEGSRVVLKNRIGQLFHGKLGQDCQSQLRTDSCCFNNHLKKFLLIPGQESIEGQFILTDMGMNVEANFLLRLKFETNRFRYPNFVPKTRLSLNHQHSFALKKDSSFNECNHDFNSFSKSILNHSINHPHSSLCILSSVG